MIRRFTIRLALLPVCYLLAAVFQLNHLVYTLLKGHYFFYQTVFYASMFSLSLIAIPPQRSSVRRTLVLSLSPVIGYLSGLIAFFLIPLQTGAGLGKLLDIRDISYIFFLSPVLTFAWLIGFYFVLLIVFLGTDGSVQKPLIT